MIAPYPGLQSARRERPAPDERVDKRTFVSSLALGLVSVGVTVLVVLALLAGAMLAAFGPAARLVTVPNVVGMPSKTAETRLDAAGLKMTVVNYEYNRNVKEGSVISISPYGGKQVRVGREVRAVVSRGSRNVKVPALKGLALEQAVSKLTNLDLQVGQTERKTSHEPPETVLSQDPRPGTVVNRKGRVDLLISGGKDFSELELADGKRFVFRTLRIIVPAGKALQLVSVEVQGENTDKSFLERMAKPGEIIDVDLYGLKGARVRAKIEDERVFSQRL